MGASNVLYLCEGVRLEWLTNRVTQSEGGRLECFICCVLQCVKWHVCSVFQCVQWHARVQCVAVCATCDLRLNKILSCSRRRS